VTDDSQTVEVFVAVYSDPAEAKSALVQLENMHKEKLIDLLDAATVLKDENGKIHVKETANHTKSDTGKGLAIGAVFGIIFPPSIIASAIVGGAAGGLFGHFTQKGFGKKDLSEAGQELDPGQTGLIAIAVDRFADQVKKGMEGYSKLTEHLLDADAAEAVTATATPSASS
jgi:uncharacterized membrane protein